ncbi:MAG TPA: bifunctional methylenetetrahydrofolate dehydrogenase/methenyltetrahydrofolate cyclohydrolase FolD [Spirochaetota bacterium]|nr:bifunctional methylenetetrahydrofolate dehydrogenase/methenyltetrahydrofolate cyclohydrolase FolD [Spirochaetota bacterium]HOK93320.1 bifunctional methylenetetrahydrofolate dehydrogenase/methenyltetrahydrofolate cyclohydrolase FolD [Spirochaetota bacterium]HPP95604.1 bifunctional methylenetetrahydrofolate dehydrogenase/methenyltetrahydrofolate cyclohydrolase FolD [Spirochaetota bacterium]
MAEIIDGKKISAEIREELKAKVAEMQSKYGNVPGLAVVLVGDDPASAVYVRMKGKGCEEIGIRSFQYILPETITEDELIALIDELNKDSKVSGILVQLPLPKHISEKAIINAIDPIKDVDGFHPINVGKVVADEDDCFYPCTPLGCQILINRYVKNLKGKHLVVVGRSSIVGKPVANMMMQKNDRANCIVTVCHTAAPDISLYTRQADILVVAAGRANTITGDMVKDGVVVIDVGVNRIADPSDPSKTIIVGDVDFKSVEPKAAAITPVPGGVGPMTIAMLLSNTVRAFELQRKG